MRAVTAFFLLAYPWLACEARCADAWENFELENGVRVTLVHAPDAPRQHFFTFISGVLLGDGAGRTQFSHLVEHMLIRATDPGSLVADGIEINPADSRSANWSA